MGLRTDIAQLGASLRPWQENWQGIDYKQRADKERKTLPWRFLQGNNQLPLSTHWTMTCIGFFSFLQFWRRRHYKFPLISLFTQRQSAAWDLGGDVEGGHPDPNLELVWGCIAWRMFSDKPFRNLSGWGVRGSTVTRWTSMRDSCISRGHTFWWCLGWDAFIIINLML